MRSCPASETVKGRADRASPYRLQGLRGERQAAPSACLVTRDRSGQLRRGRQQTAPCTIEGGGSHPPFTLARQGHKCWLQLALTAAPLRAPSTANRALPETVLAAAAALAIALALAAAIGSKGEGLRAPLRVGGKV